MNPMFKFEEAKREKCKAAIMIEGLTGQGKSGLALCLAHGLTRDYSKVFVIDTENKSANLFVDLPSSTGSKFKGFKVCQLTSDIGFKPSNYLACMEAAINAGAEVVIEDSISHAWNYKGGVLDLLNVAKASNATYAAWSDETVAKEKNELLDMIRNSKVHTITTVRVKEKMEYGVDEQGKTKLISLGEQQIQQSDLKYEPDLVLHMVRPGRVTASGEVIHPVARVVKSRYAMLDKDEEYEFTPELIEQIRVYLEEGADPADLLEQQRLDYIDAVKEYLDAKPTAKNIWTILKSEAGHKDTKLADLPLNILKVLYLKLTE